MEQEQFYWGGLAAVLLVGFGYFLWTQIKKSRNKPSGGGSVGGAPRPGTKRK